MICGVCCEKYNKSYNAKIVCEFNGCGFEACKTCTRTYLLGTTNDPHCMNCKNQWPIKFLVENLNKSFVDTDYKKHRKNLLVEREISRTPELIILAERTKLLDDEEAELQLITDEYNKMRATVRSLYSRISVKKLEIFRIKSGEDTDKEERKKFIMPCPGDTCKGYLSTQYKCELCKLFTCPDCFEIIGYTKEDAHECKDDNIKSAELIKKETKGCPKCGVRIFKISGCDQMWCTECKVAFSWNTGKIVVNGAIHNPHFYQYMQTNNSLAPRNPGDILCGGLLDYGHYRLIQNYLNNVGSIISKNVEIVDNYNIELNSNEIVRDFVFKLSIKDSNSDIVSIALILNNLHRLINHITNVDLQTCRRKVRELLNHDALTVQYILNKKSKDELANTIFKNDNIRKKNVEMLNVYELLSVVGIERFNAIYEYYIKNCSKVSNVSHNLKLIVAFQHEIIIFINEYNQLIEYCNNQLITISYTYGMTVTTICCKNYSYTTQGKKYSQNDLLKSNEKLLIKDASASCSYIDNK